MKFRLCVAAILLVPAAAIADDVLRKTNGDTLRGDVAMSSPNEVVVTRANGTEETVPVTDIERIEFEGEPVQFRLVRSSVANGNYDAARRQLERLEDDPPERAEIQADFAWYKALIAARLALGDADVRAAGELVRTFLADYPNSYHFLPATELLGDLLVAVKAYSHAEAAYAVLRDSPFPYFRMRAGAAMGRVLLEQGKPNEALAAYDEVIELAGEGGGASQRHLAVLGKANCLAAMARYDESIELIETVIEELPAEEADLHAQAYLGLGNCYRQQPGGTKPALIAFLHIHLIYSGNPAAHAESLYHLSKLWLADGHPDRSVEAATILKEQYPGSKWAAM
jgi:tetratricopeptide (TPR) repeat protein